MQIGHIQTGGTNSYIGIGGESNVYRIQLASVQYRPVDSLQCQQESSKTSGWNQGITRGAIEMLKRRARSS